MKDGAKGQASARDFRPWRAPRPGGKLKYNDIRPILLVLSGDRRDVISQHAETRDHKNDIDAHLSPYAGRN